MPIPRRRRDAHCSDTGALRRYVRETVPPAKVVTCQGCDMNPKFTHSVNEHQLSRGIVDPLLDNVRQLKHSIRIITAYSIGIKQSFDVVSGLTRAVVRRVSATRV